MATSINNIKSSINDRLVERQKATAMEIEALEMKQRYCEKAARAFSSLLPSLEQPLSKLHLELVNVRICFDRKNYDEGYAGYLEVRTVRGFRYLAKSSNSDATYMKLSAKAEKMSQSLLKALESQGVEFVNINPYSLMSGAEGSQVGDIMDIGINIRNF